MKSLWYTLLKKYICCTLTSWVHAFFSHYRTVSRDWETTMRQNVVLTVFHTQHVYHHACKTVRTTLQCIIGFQLPGKGHEMEKNCGITGTCNKNNKMLLG